jgi:hypothetical protein
MMMDLMPRGNVAVVAGANSVIDGGLIKAT